MIKEYEIKNLNFRHGKMKSAATGTVIPLLQFVKDFSSLFFSSVLEEFIAYC